MTEKTNKLPIYKRIVLLILSVIYPGISIIYTKRYKFGGIVYSLFFISTFLISLPSSLINATTYLVSCFIALTSIVVSLLSFIPISFIHRGKTQKWYWPFGLIIFLIIPHLLLNNKNYISHRVKADSMNPTLLSGEYIISDEGYQSLERGDMVVFRDPRAPTRIFVKRLIGLPGDDIAIKNKVLIINGKPISNRLGSNQSMVEGEMIRGNIKYYKNTIDGKHFNIQVNNSITATKTFDNTKIPEGAYFLMGDNRDHSYDSRYFNSVPSQNILGKVKMIYYSKIFNKIGLKF